MENEDLLRCIESADIACTRAHYAILTDSEIETRNYRYCELDGVWVYVESRAGQRVGRIVGFGLDKPADAKTLATAVDWLKHEKAKSIRVRVCPLPENSDLPVWLGELGFVKSVRMEQWSRGTEITKLSESSSNTKVESPRYPESPFTIREITTKSADVFASIVGINYHLGKNTDLSWWARQVGAPGCVAFVAYEGEEPAGTGMLQGRGDGDICVLGYGTTLKVYRKRGLQNAMIGVRVDKARELGYRLATASTYGTDRSSRNLRRQGFQSAGAVTVYAYPPKKK